MRYPYIFTALLLGFTGFHCHSGKEKIDDPATLADLAIHHAWILTMDDAMTQWESGHVLISDGLITAVVPDTGQAPPKARQMLDGRGKLLMPGLVNTHTHSSMTLFRGLADDLDLKTWLEEYIWPAEARYMDSATIRLGARLAMAEMIRGGTTTFNDMYFFVEEIAREVDAVGMRATLSEGLLNFPTPAHQTAEEAMDATRQAAENWKGHPRIRIGVGPHSVYTLSPERLQAASALADSLETLLHIHLSETEVEVATLQQQQGLRPPEYLDKLGFWNHKPTLAAHGVWLDSMDRKRLIEREVGLAHNPESNMKLASGVAPVAAWLAEGGKAGLGTDGASSNNNLDMWQELQTAAKLHKVAQLDPLAVNAREAVRMATIDGATVMGWGDQIGSVEVGKRADIILLNLDALHAIPIYDPYTHLAYAAQQSDVETVIVEGRILMLQHTLLTLSEQTLMTDVRAFMQRIRKANMEERAEAP